MIRAVSGMAGMSGLIRKEFQALDPILPAVEVDSVQRRLTEQDRPRRFQMELIGMFGGARYSLLRQACMAWLLIGWRVENVRSESVWRSERLV